MSIDLTVLIPVWNNEKEVRRAYERIRDIVSPLGRNFEILFVDDGSTDETFSTLEELRRSDSRVSILKLGRNYGQHPALAAGIAHARGEVIITMDVDLQGDPTEIPRFMEKADDGCDLVSGWRVQRKAPLLRRRLPSALMNRIVGMVAGVKLHDYGCGMNALTRKLGSQLSHYGDQQRFLKPLAASLSTQVGEVQIVDRQSLQKKSRYSMWRLVGLMLDFITSFSARPFRLVGLLGLAITVAGGLGGLAYLVGRLFLGMPGADRFQVLIFLFVFFGMQFIIAGLLGEFIVRIYHLQQRRPLYTTERHLAGDESGKEALQSADSQKVSD